MLIRPIRNLREDIGDFTEFKNVKRYIIIYYEDNNDYSCNILLANTSRQTDPIGGKLTRAQQLCSTNLYYGEILTPFLGNTTNLLRLNKNAVVDFDNYSYSHRMIEYINDNETARNIFDNVYYSEFIRYRNKDPIVSCDPRYYNVDHQIVQLDTDLPFSTRVEFEQVIDETEDGGYDRIFQKTIGHSNFYTLDELVDKHTIVKVIRRNTTKHNSLFDPGLTFKPIGNIDMSSAIYEAIAVLEYLALRAFIKEYTVIIDTELGTWVRDLKSYTPMTEVEYKEDLRVFISEIQERYEIFCDYGYKFRLVIIHNDASTNIDITPLDPRISKETCSDKPLIIKELIDDIFQSSS